MIQRNPMKINTASMAAIEMSARESVVSMEAPSVAVAGVSGSLETSP
jgi:hypothetical protein